MEYLLIRGVWANGSVQSFWEDVMRRFASSMPQMLFALLGALATLGTVAWAQQAPVMRIRGTIEAVDGPMLAIKSRDGADLKVKMTDNVAVFAVVKTSLSENKDGEKKVVVPPDTPVVTFVASDKSEVKPGAKLIIFGAQKKEDGTLEANRVNVGRDGITPPM